MSKKPTEPHDIATALIARIEANRGWTSGSDEERPSWLGRLISSFVAALGPTKIVYLSAHRTAGAHGPRVVEVVAFTKSLVARAAFELDEHGTHSAAIPVDIFDRATLSRYSVAASGSLAASEDAELVTDWRGDVCVELVYPSGIITVPSGRMNLGEDDPTLLELVETLRDDVRIGA